MSHWPRFFRVHQKFDAPVVNDVVRATIETLGTLDLRQRVKPGESVAITAGSRGIAHIAEILKAVVEHFKQLDTRPFIVPAMGSHGGGTAEGQLKVLRGYGITPEFCGCEIRASMGHVREIPKKGLGVNVKKGFTAQFQLIESKLRNTKEILQL